MLARLSLWGTVLLVLLAGLALASSSASDLKDVEESDARRRLGDDRPCVRWGNTFDVPLNSKNLLRPCSLPDGRPVCCSALANYTKSDPFAKPVGDNFHPTSESASAVDRCTLEKQYFSSPQELRDLEMAKRISAIAEDHRDPRRLEALVQYVFSEEMVRNSSRWLRRVHLHMTESAAVDAAPPHSDDYEFLSRFEVTRRCESGRVERWVEWIEPLSITARHPFGFGRCRPVRPLLSPSTPTTGRSDVDYVLLQSGRGLFKQHYAEDGRRVDVRGQALSAREQHTPIKHFMLDAGTSTFDSSLYWFTCAYSQRQVGFDQVLAWEMTLLEPKDYWRRVPPQWKPFWHFYNVPIHSDLGHADSPLRFLQQLATPEDFVAFKLDIDHPDMEMPIALSLLSDDKLAGLVDEFFFELHFRCEVMTSCGWGKRVPAESHGLVLDRPQVLQFFIDLRKKGIRAHIWP